MSYVIDELEGRIRDLEKNVVSLIEHIKRIDREVFKDEVENDIDFSTKKRWKFKDGDFIYE